MDKVVEAWRDALARSGKECELGEDLSIGFHFYIADTQEKAIKEAAKYFEENLKVFGELRLVRALTEEQIEALGDPKRAPYANLPVLEDAVKSGAVLCGPPEQIIESLAKLEDKYPGLERVSLSHPVGTPSDVILHQLEWLGSDVLPVFTGRASSLTPGFPIWAVFRLKGQPKRDSGIIFGSCKASQSPVYPIRDAILAVNHVSCPSLSSSGPREWGESALKTSRLPGALSLLARSWLYPPSAWRRR